MARNFILISTELGRVILLSEEQERVNLISTDSTHITTKGKKYRAVERHNNE